MRSISHADPKHAHRDAWMCDTREQAEGQVGQLRVVQRRFGCSTALPLSERNPFPVFDPDPHPFADLGSSRISLVRRRHLAR